MFKSLFIAAVTLTVLTGCNGEETVTQEFYLNNESERMAKIDYCNKHPDEKLVSENCLNAFSANAVIKFENMTSVDGSGLEVDYSAATESNEKTFTKEYYLENDLERNNQVSKCNKLSDIKKWSTPNCGTALAADAKAKMLKANK